MCKYIIILYVPVNLSYFKQPILGNKKFTWNYRINKNKEHTLYGHPKWNTTRGNNLLLSVVNLPSGCNPDKLFSEWRHWRSFDGQLASVDISPEPFDRTNIQYAISSEGNALILQTNTSKSTRIIGAALRRQESHKFIYWPSLLP